MKIKDILNDNSRLAFICESPHVDELKCGYPLAGYSGKEISKYLINDASISIGNVANSESLRRRLGLSAFSILNVSQLPMQRNAYIKNCCPIPPEIELYENLRTVSDFGYLPTYLIDLAEGYI